MLARGRILLSGNRDGAGVPPPPGQLRRETGRGCYDGSGVLDHHPAVEVTRRSVSSGVPPQGVEHTGEVVGVTRGEAGEQVLVEAAQVYGAGALQSRATALGERDEL